MGAPGEDPVERVALVAPTTQPTTNNNIPPNYTVAPLPPQFLAPPMPPAQYQQPQQMQMPMPMQQQQGYPHQQNQYVQQQNQYVQQQYQQYPQQYPQQQQAGMVMVGGPVMMQFGGRPLGTGVDIGIGVLVSLFVGLWSYLLLLIGTMSHSVVSGLHFGNGLVFSLVGVWLLAVSFAILGHAQAVGVGLFIMVLAVAFLAVGGFLLRLAWKIVKAVEAKKVELRTLTGQFNVDHLSAPIAV